MEPQGSQTLHHEPAYKGNGAGQEHGSRGGELLLPPQLTLIKADREEVIFTLIFDTLVQGLEIPDSPLAGAVSRALDIPGKELRDAHFSNFAEIEILELLTIMREFEIVKFDECSNRGNESFKEEFSRILLRLTDRMK